MNTEPVLKTSLVTGLVNAAVAAGGVLAAGGELEVALGAGAVALGTTLGGGAAIRQKVEPTDLAEDRRTQAIAWAEGAVYTEPDDPDASVVGTNVEKVDTGGTATIDLGHAEAEEDTRALGARALGPPPVPTPGVKDTGLPRESRQRLTDDRGADG